MNRSRTFQGSAFFAFMADSCPTTTWNTETEPITTWNFDDCLGTVGNGSSSTPSTGGSTPSGGFSGLLLSALGII